MAEDYKLCTYFKHHKHKIILFLSSMREYREELKSKKYKIHYEELDKQKSSYVSRLEKFIKES